MTTRHRLILDIALLAAILLMTGCKPKPVPDTSPKNASFGETASAETTTTPPPERLEEAASRAFFLAYEGADNYHVNITDFNEEAITPPAEGDEVCDDSECDTVRIEIGDEALPESLRDETHFTLIFDDQSRETREIAWYDFEEDGAGASLSARLKGALKGGKMALYAIAGDGSKLPDGELVRAPNTTITTLSPERLEQVYARYAAEEAHDGVFEADTIERVHETSGRTHFGIVRVLFFDLAATEEDESLFMGAVYLDEEGNYLGAIGEWEASEYYPLHWVDMEGDGTESLVMYMPYHEGESKVSFEVDAKGALKERFLYDYGL